MTRDDEAIRKAAILVSSLDRETADKLLQQMDAGRARAIRNVIKDLSGVDADEEKATIRDFLGITPSLSRTGNLSNPVSASAACGPELDRTRYPVEYVRSVSEVDFARILRSEQPQTIAVALSHLPTDRAAEIVSHLPADLQAGVLQRMVRLDQSDSSLAEDVRSEFVGWLSNLVERLIARGELAARLSKILEMASSDTRDRILEGVASSDEHLASQLGYDGIKAQSVELCDAANAVT